MTVSKKFRFNEKVNFEFRTEFFNILNKTNFANPSTTLNNPLPTLSFNTSTGAYSASKAAMTAFFESVRLDLIGKGISVTVIQPGFIRTPLTAARANKMPFLMELDDAIPLFIKAIEKRKKFAAFPWQLATIVRAGKIMPAWMYDRIAGRVRYRE